MSPKGRRHPSRQSETPKSGKPVTEKVLAAMVRRGTRYRSLRLQKRDFRFQGLPRTYSILQPESGDCCGLSTWNLTSYKIWCPCQERPAKKTTRPTVMMRSHSQVLANYQQVCRALVLRPCMLHRS